MKRPVLWQIHIGRLTCVIYTIFSCSPSLLRGTSLYSSQDSVDVKEVFALESTVARQELGQYLPKSLDTDLALLMETWRTGYTSRQRIEVPCGSYRMEDIRAIDDSILISRLKTLPTAIPIPYNAMVKEGIATYISDYPQLVRVALALGDYYFPIMEEIFDKHNLPIELTYLAVVESALNPFAVSSAGAVGLWQFMLSTGRSMGLTINSLVDERLDVYKSTEAAALYLKQLYNLFDNWLLAIAAYNCGPVNITKAIRRSGGLNSFWGIYPYLPRETRNYIPLFIGVYYACYYHNEHNICPQVQTMPLATDTLLVHVPLTFTQISQSSGIPMEQIRTLNPQYKRDVIPATESVPYILRLPLVGISQLDQTLDNLIRDQQKDQAQQIEEVCKGILQVPTKKRIKTSQSYRIYRVRRGDSLVKIAKRNGVTVLALKQANGLRGRNSRLCPGQKLKIPR